MLARSSDEGVLPGLGWIAGDVKAFHSLPCAETLALPHMGWNDVRPIRGNGLFAHLESQARFYFLHSYYFQCDRAEDAAAVTSYGTDFSSAVHAGNIFGVQFHPEKSHHWGTRLLQNFAAL
jgi:glutamine amidotransferase